MQSRSPQSSSIIILLPPDAILMFYLIGMTCTNTTRLSFVFLRNRLNFSRPFEVIPLFLPSNEVKQSGQLDERANMILMMSLAVESSEFIPEMWGNGLCEAMPNLFWRLPFCGTRVLSSGQPSLM